MSKTRKRIAAVIYILLSVIALILWFAFIVGSSFSGGVGPIPEAEYVSATTWGDVWALMLLGLVGAVLGIIAGIKGLLKNLAGKVLLICAPALGAIASISFFLMDIGEIGILAFLTSVLPTLIYLPLRGKREIQEIVNG